MIIFALYLMYDNLEIGGRIKMIIVLHITYILCVYSTGRNPFNEVENPLY